MNFISSLSHGLPFQWISVPKLHLFVFLAFRWSSRQLRFSISCLMSRRVSTCQCSLSPVSVISFPHQGEPATNRNCKNASSTNDKVDNRPHVDSLSSGHCIDLSLNTQARCCGCWTTLISVCVSRASGLLPNELRHNICLGSATPQSSFVAFVCVRLATLM